MRAERVFSPAARASHAPDPSRVLVIGCGALARELVGVIDQAALTNVDLTCLPATLHNRPGGIPAAVRARIREARPRYERIFIAYADCGTGGLLDLALADEGVERLPGAHCYEVYAGSRAFAALGDQDPATFYLTDFLARNFDRLVIRGLGLDRHPELLPAYFGNYHRLVYLAQTDDPALVSAARRAARRLGLAFELRRTGYGDLAASLTRAAGAAALEIASDASTVGGAAVGRGQSAETVHRAQGFDRSPVGRAAGLHAAHVSVTSARAGRRSVHVAQRDPDTLHLAQRSIRACPPDGIAAGAHGANGQGARGAVPAGPAAPTDLLSSRRAPHHAAGRAGAA